MAALRNPYDPYGSTEGLLAGDQYDPMAGASEQGGWNGSTPIEIAPGGQLQTPPDPAGREKVQPVPQYQQPVQPSGFTPNPSAPSFNDINSAVQQYTGRAETPQEYNQYWSYGDTPADWQKNWLNTIQNSDEAKAYSAKNAAAQAPTNPAFQPQLPGHVDLDTALKGLFSNGGNFNQDIVNRRTEGARENLGRYRKSAVKNNEAYLADRGLIGSGPQTTAAENLDTRLGEQYGTDVSNIYANESQNADQRMLSALQQATGLSESDARNIIDQFRSSTERSLGLGRLASDNASNANAYNLGLGNLGLNRDIALNNADNADIDRLIKLIEQLQGGAQTSANGYY